MYKRQHLYAARVIHQIGSLAVCTDFFRADIDLTALRHSRKHRRTQHKCRRGTNPSLSHICSLRHIPETIHSHEIADGPYEQEQEKHLQKTDERKNDRENDKIPQDRHKIGTAKTKSACPVA